MTEEATEKQLSKASKTRRCIAFLIDQLFFSFLMAIGMALFTEPNLIDNEDMNSVNKNILILMSPLLILFFSKESIQGISFGKWVMGIMVRTEASHEIPSKGKLLLRNLFLVISPLEFLTLISSKNKQRLGDKVTQTVVLNNPKKIALYKRIIGLIILFSLTYVLSTISINKTIRSSKAYEVTSEYIEKNEKIAEKFGDILKYESTSRSQIKIRNNYGNASIEVHIEGTKHTETIRFFLKKEPKGKWVVIETE